MLFCVRRSASGQHANSGWISWDALVLAQGKPVAMEIAKKKKVPMKMNQYLDADTEAPQTHVNASLFLAVS